MKQKKFSLRVRWLFVVIVLAACSPKTKELTIIHFNDDYNLAPIAADGSGGVAQAKTLIDTYSQNNPLLLFSGDCFGGSFASATEKGANMVDGFNHLGVDFAVMGNHEFDFGVAVAGERVRESKFTWLLANIVDPKTKAPIANAKAVALTEWNGVKVGLIGLGGNWLPLTMIGTDGEYEDAETMARAAVADLKKQGAELIIALTHMYLADDIKLAQTVPDIDLILGGHDHEPMQKRVGQTLIWKSGSDLNNLGVINVKISDHAVSKIQADLVPVSATLAEDPELEKLTEAHAQKLAASSQTALGETETPWDVRRSIVRRQEAAIGNLIADALRETAQTQVAFTNGGGLRADQVYPPGPVTLQMLQTILPFPNKLVSLRVSGKNLRAVLEHGLSGIENLEGRFPQVSGLSYVFDSSQPVGQRLQSVLVAGKPLQENRSYTLATLNFLAQGGDGYEMLKTVPRLTSETDGPLVLQVVTDYIKKKGIVATTVEGRITDVAAPASPQK